MDLTNIHAELVHEIRGSLAYFVEPAQMSELGDVVDTLTVQLEALALCHIFELGDQTQFRENLTRAGQARRFFLRRSQSEGNVADRHLAVSRTRAFLDAVVAGSLSVARDIAHLSTGTWNRNWEYEDDFCFYSILHSIVTDPADDNTLQSLLARFEAALHGAESHALAACKALVMRDGSELEAAIGALVSAEKAQIDKQRDSAAVHERDILFWPKSKISIEGLALLNVGALRGLQLQAEWPLCPALARLPWVDGPTLDLFEEIEQLG